MFVCVFSFAAQVWNTGCNLSIAFLVSFICFYKALRGVLLNPLWVPIQFAHTFPLLLLFYVVVSFLVSGGGGSLSLSSLYLPFPCPPLRLSHSGARERVLAKTEKNPTSIGDVMLEPSAR